MTTLSGGVYLRRKGSFGACDGNLRVQLWHLAVETSGVIADLAMGLAAAHVPSQAPLAHPKARIADRLAPKGATRTGDFGEFLAAVLYADRFGEIVPFQKLSTKPVAGATQQGADVLALSPLPADMPRAGAIEIKVRAAISPKALLEDIANSVRRVDPDYLVGAWNAAVNAMEAHPDHAQSFALAAAISLAQLDRPSQPGPDHEHHAVIITESATLHAATINQYWGSHPPVSELQLIEVPALVGFIDKVYEAAAELSYSNTVGSAPAYLAGLGVTPGVAAAVSVTSARDAVAATGGVAGVEEVALWYLAGWDGMAAARADQIIHDASSTEALGLAWLLFGSSRRALDTFNHTGPLADLSEAAAELWQQRSDLDNFCNAADATVAAIADPGLGRATRLAAAAISYRFDRHPVRLLAAAGATGANVAEVVRNLTRKGRRALWPSQAKAVQAGLFDAHEKGLAIKMPTSAGKTLLIQLAVAHTLDLDASGVAAVIAPTKALVRQLTHDLREVLPKSTSVRSSQGGLDYDEPASAGALLAEAGVVVVTPERLDLEWRRAVTSTEGTNIENLRLLVVDEAHLVAETSRGGRLEQLIARALRAGVRVILLSSQFPDTARLESWLGTARALLDERAALVENRAPNTSEYLLTGMLRCRACGGAYFGAGTKGRNGFYRYYACRNRQTKGTYGCQSTRIPAEDLEAAVIDDLIRTLSRSDLFEQAITAAIAEVMDSRPFLESELASTEAQLRDTETGLNHYLRAFETGEMPAAICSPRVTELTQRRDELAAHRKKLSCQIEAAGPQLPTPDQPRSLCTEIRRTIDSGNPHAVKQLLRELIDRVEITTPERHAYPYFWVPAGCETGTPSAKPGPDASPVPSHQGDTGWLFMANRGGGGN